RARAGARHRHPVRVCVLRPAALAAAPAARRADGGARRPVRLFHPVARRPDRVSRRARGLLRAALRRPPRPRHRRRPRAAASPPRRPHRCRVVDDGADRVLVGGAAPRRRVAGVRGGLRPVHRAPLPDGAQQLHPDGGGARAAGDAAVDVDSLRGPEDPRPRAADAGPGADRAIVGDGVRGLDRVARRGRPVSVVRVQGRAVDLHRPDRRPVPGNPAARSELQRRLRSPRSGDRGAVRPGAPPRLHGLHGAEAGLVTMTVRHRAGLVGAGYIAEYHVGALRALPGVELVGVTDLSAERPAALAEPLGTRSHPSLAALRDAGADAIHVLTPPDSHADVAVAALELGCHVLVEKPLATSVDACQRIQAAAAAAGRSASLNHSLLFDPPIVRALELVRAGKLGQVVSVDILRGSMYPPYRGGPLPPQYRSAAYPFRDLGVHALYLFQAFLGPIEGVSAIWESKGGDPNLA